MAELDEHTVATGPGDDGDVDDGAGDGFDQIILSSGELDVAAMWRMSKWSPIPPTGINDGNYEWLRKIGVPCALVTRNNGTYAVFRAPWKRRNDQRTTGEPGCGRVE